MELDEIEVRTRAALPEWASSELSLEVIEKGGSGRLFIRVVEKNTEASVIVMHYSLDRPDNSRFASITDFLNSQGIPAPRIQQRREDLHLLWVDDLGSIDLGNLAGDDWESTRRPAYEAALRSVFPLHRIFEKNAPIDLPELEKCFDEDLYEWEQNYFLTHYVERFLPAETALRLRSDASLANLRLELAGMPRSLVHRDFQSTNVMLHRGSSYLIDYQGLRWGLPEYDLASMIYDPYSEFTETETEDLLEFYFGLKRAAGDVESREVYERRLTQCAMQRLMQALGAYGFLSEVKGKKEFLAHIPTAKRRLGELARKEGGLSILAEVLS